MFNLMMMLSALYGLMYSIVFVTGDPIVGHYTKEFEHKFGTGKLTFDVVRLTPFRCSLNITLTPLIERPESVSYNNIGVPDLGFVTTSKKEFEIVLTDVMYDNLMDTLREYFGYWRYGGNLRNMFYDYEEPNQIEVTVNGQMLSLPRTWS